MTTTTTLATPDPTPPPLTAADLTLVSVSRTVTLYGADSPSIIQGDLGRDLAVTWRTPSGSTVTWRASDISGVSVREYADSGIGFDAEDPTRTLVADVSLQAIADFAVAEALR